MNSLPHISCVYAIRCTIDNRVYVGSTQDLHRRWQSHLGSLRAGRNGNHPLQEAWNEYGETCFQVEILESVEKWQLLEREAYWFEQLGVGDEQRCFNLSRIPGVPMGGLTHSDATRQRYSETRRGELNANYRGKRIQCPTCGTLFRPDSSKSKYCSHACYAIAPKSDETLFKYGNAQRGKKLTTETLERRFEARAQMFVVTSPTDEQTTIKGLAKFCREHGLDQGSMSRVALGQQRTHKGWRCRKLS